MKNIKIDGSIHGGNRPLVYYVKPWMENVKGVYYVKPW
jgi:hypothetical protein